MSRNLLCVRNLVYDYDSDTLKLLFKNYGTPRNIYCPENRDLCFIEMNSLEEAEVAVRDLNKSLFEGREIVVYQYESSSSDLKNIQRREKRTDHIKEYHESICNIREAVRKSLS